MPDIFKLRHYPDRDRLALDAAWGVHYALYSSLATIAILVGGYVAYDQRFWIIGIGIGIAVVISQLAIHAWSNGERMKEVDKLAKLPEWEWKVH